MSWRDLDTASARHNAYITSPAWVERCDAYWATHPRICRGCERRTGVTLHHATYDRMGNEPDEDLVPVCRKCHESIHAEHRASTWHEDLDSVTDRVITSIQQRRVFIEKSPNAGMLGM